MNIMIAAVGADPGSAVGRGGSGESMFIGGVSLAGLVLLVAAAFLCRRGHAHAAHYSAPRH